MKSKKFVGCLCLLAVLALPMVTNAATTNGGYSIYSTGNNGNSTGTMTGFIGNKSQKTPGVSFTCSSGHRDGYLLVSDSGAWWSQISASVNPYYGSGSVENGAKDYTGWTSFRY